MRAIFKTLFCLYSIIFSANVYGSKILVVTGNPRSDCTKSEVISLDNENEICQDFPDFPKEIERAVGGLFFESPLICGGAFYDGHHSSNECQVLNTNSKQPNWQTFGTLSKNRTFAGMYMQP